MIMRTTLSHQSVPVTGTFDTFSPIASLPGSRTTAAIYWVVTVVFCLQMGFTAYAQLRLPEVSLAFQHLGFPGYFRVELSWAKFLGILVLLAPAAAWLKEWAYAGFAITLISAFLAHFAVNDPPLAWSWAAGTSVLWLVSFFLWRRMQTMCALRRSPEQ
jgi:hypothetical protein